MKRLFLIVSILTLIVSCSNSNDEPDAPIQVETTIIPNEFKGAWKVDYFTSSDGNWNPSSQGTFYLKFNNDNTIEVKDVNGTFSGPSKNIWNNFTITLQNNVKILIYASNSSTHPGYKTFSIHYQNAPSHFEQRFYDAKKQ
jgi:hypothetical protein